VSLLAAILLGLPMAPAACGDDALEARRAQISALPPAEQQELLRRQERFSALSVEEQDRLRALQAAIDADPNADRLRQVLARYHEWLKTLTPSQRAKLADLAPKERVSEIKKIQEQQETARDRSHRADLLSWVDMREVLRWTEDFVWVHRQDLLADMSQEQRQRFEKRDRQRQRRELLFRAFERARRERSGGPFEVLKQADMDRLVAKLSDPARQAMAGASTLAAQRKILGTWIGTSMHRLEPWNPGRKQNPMGAEELLQYLQNEVPPTDRQRLLKMPREKMLEELRGMYFERGRGEAGSGGTRPPWFDGRSKGGPRGQGRSRQAAETPAESTPAGEKAPADNKAERPPESETPPAKDEAPKAPPSPEAAPSASEAHR
jgi:hypothetical protein